MITTLVALITFLCGILVGKALGVHKQVKIMSKIDDILEVQEGERYIKRTLDSARKRHKLDNKQ